jgi:thioredoxin
MTMKLLKCTLLFAAILISGNCAFAESGKENTDNSPVKSGDDITGEVIILNKGDFLKKIFNYEKNTDKWVYEGVLPCIIDFYADWCGPCKIVEPILKQIAKDYKGKVIIYKINTDNERELASAFGIRSIPTYFFIPAKGDPQSTAGAMPRESFVRIIDEFLLK